MKKMLVVVVEPNKEPEIREIEDTLESYQKVIGGWLELVVFHPRPRYTVYADEEGLNKQLPLNRVRPVYKGKPSQGVHRLHGTILILKEKGLTRKEAEEIVKDWAL